MVKEQRAHCFFTVPLEAFLWPHKGHIVAKPASQGTHRMHPMHTWHTHITHTPYMSFLLHQRAPSWALQRAFQWHDKGEACALLLHRVYGSFSLAVQGTHRNHASHTRYTPHAPNAHMEHTHRTHGIHRAPKGPSKGLSMSR